MAYYNSASESIELRYSEFHVEGADHLLHALDSQFRLTLLYQIKHHIYFLQR